MNTLCLAALLLSVAMVSSHYVPVVQSDEDVEEFPRRDNIDERGPYHGGDMRLNEDQLEELKQGLITTSYRWPGGRIPYIIDSSFPANELSEVQKALDDIAKVTCIKFFPRTSETNYVNIQRGASGTGCWADVGMQPGKANTVNIQGNYGYGTCADHGTVAHELIHAIGFYHEQSRPDRDDYVTINFSNIQQAYQYNFDKMTTSEVVTYTPYDYDSLMHYSAYAFATNTAITTINPRQSGVDLSRLGQRNGPSANDAKKINAMYKGICA